MINKRRVQRIKKVIYTFLIIMLFLPVVLLIALLVILLSLTGKLDQLADQAPVPTPVPSIIQPLDERPVGDTAAESSRPQADTTEHSQPDTVQVDPVELDAPGDTDSSGDQPEAGPTPASFVPNSYTPDYLPELLFDTLAAPSNTEEGPGSLYLTFDNTPNAYLDELLRVLDKHGVKATFFVWWGTEDNTYSGPSLRKIAQAGHTLGIHSFTNTDSFSQLYQSKEYFLADFYRMFEKIYEETGVKTRFYRLPGGSVHPYDPERQAVLLEIKEELDARGFLQYDWNAAAQDAVRPSLTKEQILDNLYSSVADGTRNIVLLHDGTGSSTVEALDVFIGELSAKGHTFNALNYDITPVSFLDKN